MTESEPSRKRKIATFTVERSERPSKKVQLHNDRGTAGPEHAVSPLVNTQTAEPTSQRKRPGASTALSKGPARNGNTAPQASRTVIVGEDAAFKSLLAETEDKEETSGTGQAPTTSKYRFLPKATTRLKDRIPPGGMQSEDAMDVDQGADTEYVYDTYILDDAMDYDLQSAEPGSVGLLHIDEEQQPIWETYLDETDSDEDYRSDDEDSNAEDYYGADYPEDELDIDDEYDVDAYKFRHGASDDEEYGLDEPSYSDNEDENKIPKWSNH